MEKILLSVMAIGFVFLALGFLPVFLSTPRTTNRVTEYIIRLDRLASDAGVIGAGLVLISSIILFLITWQARPPVN